MTKQELNNNKLIEEAFTKKLQQHTRRHFIKESAMGLGALALGSLLGCGKTGSSPNVAAAGALVDATNPLLPKPPHFAGKARAVIFIHMAGAPSQLELFSYKPALEKLDGQNCPPSLLEGKRFAFIRGVPKMLGPQAVFKQHGQSGLWLSNHLPHLSTVADEMAMLQAVTTDQFNHAPAQLLLHSGSARQGRPSLGSWVTYGLGSENKDLPGFVVLTSGGNNPDAGKSVWGSGFLPSVYQGVQCRSKGDPVLFLKDPNGISRDIRRASLDAINAINQQEYKEYQDPEILSRIAQYEMAYKMQVSVPGVMNINDEPQQVLDMYGAKPGEGIFANNVLLARKLVEKGVRFVQLFDWGWDTHGDNADAAIEVGLINKCRSVDKPIAALLLDLKQRGLLDETLVVWGAEFGRTPMQENREGKTMPFKGRDHHGEAFSIWMAGGGVKGGTTYGETDEIGYSIVSGKTEVFDVQATLLHLLGFNHEQLTYPSQGRPFRLTDVSGKVIHDILA
jgi:hypothetical protein